MEYPNTKLKNPNEQLPLMGVWHNAVSMGLSHNEMFQKVTRYFVGNLFRDGFGGEKCCEKCIFCTALATYDAEENGWTTKLIWLGSNGLCYVHNGGKYLTADRAMKELDELRSLNEKAVEEIFRNHQKKQQEKKQ